MSLINIQINYPQIFFINSMEANNESHTELNLLESKSRLDKVQ